jgi:hypothetical protein
MITRTTCEEDDIMSTRSTAETRQILAARFSTPDGGSRVVAALTGALGDKIGNAAVL